MRSLLAQFAVRHNVNFIHIDDGAQTMRAVDHSFAPHQVVKLLSYFFLGFCVKARRRLVEEEYFGVLL